MNELSDYFYVFGDRYADLYHALLQHLLITGIAVLAGTLVAVPLGIFLSKNGSKWVQTIVFSITNIFQTVPSLALLAILIPLIGIGLKPAIFALFLYSIMPILRNTFAAFESIDPEIIESAKGMGYTSLQQLIQVEVPLTVPYIMSGIRLTTVYIINWATLAGFIGAGGLGELILSGMGVNNKPLVLAASIIAMALAFVTDLLLGFIEKTLSKQHSSREYSTKMEEEKA